MIAYTTFIYPYVIYYSLFDKDAGDNRSDLAVCADPRTMIKSTNKREVVMTNALTLVNCFKSTDSCLVNLPCNTRVTKKEVR